MFKKSVGKDIISLFPWSFFSNVPIVEQDQFLDKRSTKRGSSFFGKLNSDSFNCSVIGANTADNSTENNKASSDNDIAEFFHLLIYMVIGMILAIPLIPFVIKKTFRILDRIH
jgi:hypothetical protein